MLQQFEGQVQDQGPWKMQQDQYPLKVNPTPLEHPLSGGQLLLHGVLQLP